MNYANPAHFRSPGLLADDDVLATFCGWRAQGLQAALVTLVAIDGGSPRPVGAQMAVCADGRYAGYLSGGCLEQAIVLEAQELLSKGESRLVRYGKGSPYFDVKLPCGSGIDLYFDCEISDDLARDMLQLRQARRPFALEVDLSGAARVLVKEDGAWDGGSRREGARFTRVYVPEPRLVLFGAGPAVGALAAMAQAAGLGLDVWAGDDATRTSLAACGIPSAETPAPPEAFFDAIDASTAVIVAFHEHDREPALIERILKSPCFYIGVLGSMTVHRRRLEYLETLGVGSEALARLRAPIGAIPMAKGKATLAVGALAEILAEAKVRGLVW